MTNSGAVRHPDEQQREWGSGANLNGLVPLLGAAGHGCVGCGLRRVHAAGASWATYADPRAKNADPGAKNADPGAKNADPAAKNDDHGGQEWRRLA